MIDRYLIRYFLAVLDHGTFTKAAQHCRVAQPTLSLGIAKLERELKHPLFNRNSRRVELTPAGVRFARFARRIEADFSNVEQEIADEPPSKLIRLGIATTIPVRWTGALLVAARTAAPSEQLEIVEGTVRELNAKLERGRIDLSFGPLPQSSSSHPVVDEGYRVAMPTHHPLAGQSPFHRTRRPPLHGSQIDQRRRSVELCTRRPGHHRDAAQLHHRRHCHAPPFGFRPSALNRIQRKRGRKTNPLINGLRRDGSVGGWSRDRSCSPTGLSPIHQMSA
jgi:DNA-binding transcriptional LysR family regulator